MEQYWKARGYAYKLDRVDYIDVVHDAYVSWHKKTGDNLFTEHPALVAAVVKGLMKNRWRSRKYMWRGKLYNKTTYTISEDIIETTTPNFVPTTYTTPQTELEIKQTLNRLEQSLTSKQKLVYDLLIAGYTRPEIAEELVTMRQIVTGRFKHIYNKLNTLLTN